VPWRAVRNLGIPTLTGRIFGVSQTSWKVVPQILLTDIQIKNARPNEGPPVRRKGDPSKGAKAAGMENGQETKNHTASAGAATKPEERAGSYKLYDREGLSIQTFANGSKMLIQGVQKISPIATPD